MIFDNLTTTEEAADVARRGIKSLFRKTPIETSTVSTLTRSAPLPPCKAINKKNSIAVRFRNFNIMLLALAFCITVTVMAVTFSSVISQLSYEFTGRYAVSTAETLSAIMDKEIGLLAKAARSNAVADWILDEYDSPKRMLAYEEMMGIVSELYSINLYVGIGSSLHEYRIEKGRDAGAFNYIAVLNQDNDDDAWYFSSVKTDGDFMFNVGIDHTMQRKRIWLNHKVMKDGAVIGIICTGLDFPNLTGGLFSKYEGNNIRGLIVDSSGTIFIDSELMDNRNFLRFDYDAHIENEFSDPLLLAALSSYFSKIGDGAGSAGVGGTGAGDEGAGAGASGAGGTGAGTGTRAGTGASFDWAGGIDLTKIASGKFRYMAAVPIRNTKWSVVILSGAQSQFSLSLFIPVSLTILILMVAFALATNTINYRLIFMPLGKLGRSLILLKENIETKIYGSERDDELGELSKTIQDLFSKANYDTLTGIYNRRFMENNLVHIIEMLSRSNGMLSTLMIDIDFFKPYNDTFGHDQGDICLRKVAEAISGGVTRANDFAARYGGEEFVVVLPNTSEAGARVVAEKLLNGVRELRIPHSGSDVAPYITVSIGVTTGMVTYMHSWEDYIKLADKALYMSKQNGRNQYTYLTFPQPITNPA